MACFSGSIDRSFSDLSEIKLSISLKILVVVDLILLKPENCLPHFCSKNCSNFWHKELVCDNSCFTSEINWLGVKKKLFLNLSIVVLP